MSMKEDIEALVKDIDEHPCVQHNIYVDAQHLKEKYKSELSVHVIMHDIYTGIKNIPLHSMGGRG